jgi:hypothetical protein
VASVIDPWLSYFGHPKLPAGYDSWDHNGDDINGAGVNEPVWPQLFDTFFALEVVIVTEEMMEIFVTGCPDYVVRCDRWQISMPAADSTILITDAWSEITLPTTSRTVVFPQEARTHRIKEPT